MKSIYYSFFKTQISFKLKEKDERILRTNNIQDVCFYLKDSQLQENLCHSRSSAHKNLDEHPEQALEKEKFFAHYSKVNTFFSALVQGKYTINEAQNLSKTLMKELGQKITLGF